MKPSQGISPDTAFSPHSGGAGECAGSILLRKTSLVDYPGRVASVFFFAGCNLRCPWCHNRELVSGGAEGLVGAGLISTEEALAHVAKRRGVLGGVVLSGGEPCLREELPFVIEEIKKLGLPVKLDTNGTLPRVLETLLSREETRPDYIALDLKIAPGRYAELLPRGTAAGNPGEALIQSAALVRSSGIEHEFRSLTLPAPFFTQEDSDALAPLARGSPWHFRPFRPGVELM